MIRINLLGADRDRAKKKTPLAIPVAHRVTIGVSIVLVATIVGIGWWFWTLRQESIAVDKEIAAAELETRSLRSVLSQVQQFEARRAQLQQRVTLIEQLRKGQSEPVRVLDQISRSVPDRLWLHDMTQSGSDFTLTGFTTSMTALSDFVAAIEGTRWFRKPVEILDSQMTSDAKAGDIVKFVVKASYFDPDAPPPAPAAKPVKKP
jgi:type IV pilus assembly protein PilN